jgi:hypothetical protein
LSAKERFACLGFDVLDVPDSSASFDDQFSYLQAAGNTFTVPIFKGLLSGYCSSITNQGIPECSPIGFSYLSQEEALSALGHPSGKASRQ